MTTREASHAGSWYTDDPDELSAQLDSWLAAVPSRTKCIGSISSSQTVDIPTPGARAIIAPHAGYAYSGPAAAWAYKAVDWSKAKRVFLLGPSHHYYLTGCALSECQTYNTPLGELRLDLETIAALRESNMFDSMNLAADEAEHSLEMHLPYIHRMLSKHFPPSALPPLVPILVGSTSPATESRYGALLAPYLASPENIFVVSSDFCHWGSRFRYTYYEQARGGGTDAAPATGRHLRAGEKPPRDPPIHASIAAVDMRCVDAIESGSHAGFLAELDRTGNTVCGRHPIGVVMAAVEALEEQGALDAAAPHKGRFRFVRYERSSLVQSVRDSSVSYCSAFAVF